MKRTRLSVVFALIGFLGGAYVDTVIFFDLGHPLQLPVTTALCAATLGHLVDREVMGADGALLAATPVAGAVNGVLALWFLKGEPFAVFEPIEDGVRFSLVAMLAGAIASIAFLPALWWLGQTARAPSYRLGSVAAAFRERALPSAVCAVIASHGAAGLLPFGLAARPLLSSVVIAAWIGMLAGWWLDLQAWRQLRKRAARWNETVTPVGAPDDDAPAMDFGEGDEERVVLSTAPRPYRDQAVVVERYLGRPKPVLRRATLALAVRGTLLLGTLGLMLQGPLPSY